MGIDMRFNEIFNGHKVERLIEMSNEDITEIDQVMSNVFMRTMGLRFNISTHFNRRMVPRPDEDSEHAREDDVTKSEVYTTFKKMIDTKRDAILNRKKSGKEVEFIVSNTENNVNVVFKVAYQYNDKNPLLRVITIMRKKNFKPKPTDVVLTV